MVHGYYIFKASRGKAKIITEILKSVCERTRYLPGCISCELWFNATNSGTILLCEEWDSMAAMQEYLHSGIYRNVLEAMELCKEKPIVKFIENKNNFSFDWLEGIFMEKIRFTQ